MRCSADKLLLGCTEGTLRNAYNSYWTRGMASFGYCTKYDNCINIAAGIILT
jgi:hypothetical protein